MPTIQASDALDMSAVHWIVVIEKEVRTMVASTSQLTNPQATFRSVISSPVWKVLGAQGLILTVRTAGARRSSLTIIGKRLSRCRVEEISTSHC